MNAHRSLTRLLLSSDAKVRRLLRFWAIGLGLYAVSVAMLWFEASARVAPQPEVAWLSLVSLAGVALAYLAIRMSRRLRLSVGLLNTGQSLFAIACVIAAYSLVGPMRGVTLCILTVVLVFGAFSSTPLQMRVMCSFAVVLLATAMVWKSQVDAVRYPAREEFVHFVLAATMLGAVAYMAQLLSRLRSTLKERTGHLGAALARIEDMAAHDELTRLINRRQMMETLKREVARCERNGETVCLAVIDIDDFKRVNDALGHAAGDAVLASFAEHALATVRRSDVLARWGGEEFLLLLPATGLDAAEALLERVRARVAESVRIDADPSLRVTFSAGLIEPAPAETVDAAIDRADRAMYAAKRQGRDRIVCMRGSMRQPTGDASRSGFP